MCGRFVSCSSMPVCTARGVQAASACPSSASRKESGRSARAALLDTILMVSIFIMGLPSLILAILAGIVFPAIRQGPAEWPKVPKKQPLFAAQG